MLRRMARILVIDDDPRLRRQCVALLQAEGFATIEAGNGRDGVTEPPRRGRRNGGRRPAPPRIDTVLSEGQEIVVQVEGGDATAIEEKLSDSLGLRVPVVEVATGSLPRYEFKASRWKSE